MSSDDIDGLLMSMSSEMYGTSGPLVPQLSLSLSNTEPPPIRYVEIEAARHKAVSSLSGVFQELCTPYFNPKRWYKHFESWLWHQRAISGASNTDSVLPDTPACTVDYELCRKLVKNGATVENAAAICRTIGEKSTFLSRKISELSLDVKYSIVKQSTIQLPNGDTKIRLTYKDTAVEINSDSYRKLDMLHKNAGGERTKLLSNMFKLLVRYSSAQGACYQAGGNQAAIHPRCMDVLVSKFGVKGECFASPMNCYYPAVIDDVIAGQDLAYTYCSAFPDTDTVFGSVGSFDSFTPTHGCYEANPPFDPLIVHNMYARMHGLLATAEERRKVLMFVIIMPYWEEAESSDPEELVTFYREESANRVTKRNAWTEIAESQFLSKSLRLEASQHGYMEGAQHAKKNQHRVSSQDTSIFFLQTSKAKRKYPLDESSVQLLVDAFRPITTVETNNTSESSTSKRVVKRKKNTTNTKNDRKKSRFK